MDNIGHGYTLSQKSRILSRFKKRILGKKRKNETMQIRPLADDTNLKVNRNSVMLPSELLER